MEILLGHTQDTENYIFQKLIQIRADQPKYVIFWRATWLKLLAQSRNLSARFLQLSFQSPCALPIVAMAGIPGMRGLRAL